MSFTVTYNGSDYTIPDYGDSGWSENLNNYFSALATGSLTKGGGSFFILSDVNLGNNYGLISEYYKSNSTNIATSGELRLGNTDTIQWRNGANSGNLTLSVSGDKLYFNGSPVTPDTSSFLSTVGGTYVMGSQLVLTSNGITSPNFKSGSSNPATVGILRLSNTDTIQWRNAGNSANLSLNVSGSDLYWDSVKLNTEMLSECTDVNIVSPTNSQVLVYNTTTSKWINSSGIPVVSSISALRDVKKDTCGQVFVTGYYASGDGGGGQYWYDSSDTTSTDNGGTVIVANDGGRWKLIVRGAVSVEQFGAVGDGVTNSYTALNAAFAQTDYQIFIPAGTFLTNSALAEPVCPGITGVSDLVSIIKIGSGLTVGLSLGQECRIHENYQILGNSTNSAIGINFGDAESGSYRVRNIRVKNFTGTDAIGVKINKALKSIFTAITTEGCYDGIVCNGTDTNFPTTCTMIGCVSTNSTRYGARVLTGYALLWQNCDFESSGKEGLLIDPTSTYTEALVFDNCWFEDNFIGKALTIVSGGTGYSAGDVLTVTGGTYSVAMQITVDTVSSGVITSAHISQGGIHSVFPTMPFSTTGGGGSGASFRLNTHVKVTDNGTGTQNIRPEFRSCRYSQNTDTPRGMLFDGVGVNPTINNPVCTSALYPSILHVNGAGGDYSDANNAYDYSILVSAPDNKINWTMTGWRDYTPTFATNVGNAAASFAAGPTIAHSRFRKQGKTLHVSMNFSGTLLAITPTNINITLPTNISISRNTNISVNIDINGTKRTARLATDVGTNKLYIQKSDLSNWTSGATFSVLFDMLFEIA